MVVTCTSQSTHGIFGHANFSLHALVLRTLPHSPGGVLVVSLDHLSKSPRKGGGILCTHTMHHLGDGSIRSL